MFAAKGCVISSAAHRLSQPCASAACLLVCCAFCPCQQYGARLARPVRAKRGGKPNEQPERSNGRQKARKRGGEDKNSPFLSAFEAFKPKKRQYSAPIKAERRPQERMRFIFVGQRAAEQSDRATAAGCGGCPSGGGGARGARTKPHKAAQRSGDGEEGRKCSAGVLCDNERSGALGGTTRAKAKPRGHGRGFGRCAASAKAIASERRRRRSPWFCAWNTMRKKKTRAI